MASRKDPRKGPSRPMPKGPKPGSKPSKRKPSGTNLDQVVQRLQKLVQEKNLKIDALTGRINELDSKNKALERKVDNLSKAQAAPKKKKPAGGGGGIETGMSQGGAAAALAKKLGGKHNLKSSSGGGGGGVSTGMSQAGAKNALAGLFGAKKPPSSSGGGGGGGVSAGMSQGGAKNALAGLLGAKKKPPAAASSSSSGAKKGGGGKGFAQYASLFKKYEMMMKLGINVHGAMGRMRQNGEDKAAIEAFGRKHGAFDDEEEKVDAASLGLKPKKEVVVGKGIKMKRLHWDPSELKSIKGSIWEDLDESSIRYDRKHFELHFQVRQRKPVDEQKSKERAVANSGEIITFVSKKKTQNVLIGVKNLNMDNDTLRKVLMDMDAKRMDVDTLSKLLEIVPTEDEQQEAEKKIMVEGTRNPKNYGVAEQFYFALCDFYNLSQRLRLWMFAQNFAEICSSLQDQYKTIQKACDKIKNDKNLKLLLTIVLVFGNHMNSGTRKGCTYGFELKILTQMTGVKSFDNTRSLLMYIYEFCDRKYPKAISVLGDLMTTVKSAASMEVETLNKAHARIKDNMQEIKNLVTSDEIENYDLDDKFIMVMTKFHKEATPKMKRFNMTVGNVTVSTKRVMKKYAHGTEDNPETIEGFFDIWRRFFEDLRAAKEKLIKLEKERQKRIKKRKAARAKEIKKKMHQKYGNKSLPNAKGGAGGGDDEGPELHKGSSLYREFEKRQKFDTMKEGLHGKLHGHVKQRSIFVQNGGKLDGKGGKLNDNATMRRLSSMYQDQQSEVKKLEDARKAAAIANYNKFRLPAVNHKDRAKVFNGNNKFEISDNRTMRRPMPKARRGQPSAAATQTKPKIQPKTQIQPKQKIQPKSKAPQSNGHSQKFSPNGHRSTSPKQKVKPNYKVKPKQAPQGVGGHVPPPPDSTPPASPQNVHNNGRVGNGMAYQPQYGVHNGQNPQAAWAAQQQLGFGSSPNLGYNPQFKQPPAQQQAWQQRQQQQQQQQQGGFGQKKPYYNAPYNNYQNR